MDFAESIESLKPVIGTGGIRRLDVARVFVLGVGGSGSYAVEALVRAGVGYIDIIDNDTIAPEHVGRQLTAYFSVNGRPKADVCRERIALINPDCVVNSYEIFVTPDNICEFPITECDYVVDTLSSIPVKIAVAKYCEDNGVPVISCMSAVNRINPSLFRIADIYDTDVCPIAAIMREELRRNGVRGLKTVYSSEPQKGSEDGGVACLTYASGIMGLMAAGEVIMDLLQGVAN